MFMDKTKKWKIESVRHLSTHKPHIIMDMKGPPLPERIDNASADDTQEIIDLIAALKEEAEAMGFEVNGTDLSLRHVYSGSKKTSLIPEQAGIPFIFELKKQLHDRLRGHSKREVSIGTKATLYCFVDEKKLFAAAERRAKIEEIDMSAAKRDLLWELTDRAEERVCCKRKRSVA